jgi:rod shape-determining protein MreC
MEPFRRFDRSTSLFIGLLIVSFLTATIDVRSQGGGIGDTLRDGTQSLFAPIQEAASVVTRPIVGFVDGISNIAGLREENERLRDRVRELESEVSDIVGLQNRLEALERISDLEPPGDLAAITARIFSVGVSEFDHIRWIDRGSDDGVVVGHTVIDEDGLVGRVDFATDSRARVRLISDPRNGVGVRNLDTNETGIVEGQGSGLLRLKMFNAEQSVEEGHLIVTEGDRFAPGIVVGSVAESAEPEAGFSLITDVFAAVDFSRIDFVKVIVGWLPSEFSAPIDPGNPIPPDPQPFQGN